MIMGFACRAVLVVARSLGDDRTTTTSEKECALFLGVCYSSVD